MAMSASGANPRVASFSSAVSVPGQAFPLLFQRNPNRSRSAPIVKFVVVLWSEPSTVLALFEMKELHAGLPVASECHGGPGERFEASSRKATPRGLPSSPTQHRSRNSASTQLLSAFVTHIN